MYRIMDALQGLVLGILQGMLEWLPVSSEGQSMLAMIHWLRLSPGDALSYSIFLHLGTMCAAIIKFRHEFLMMLKDFDSKLTRIVVVSSICTGITGLPLYFLFKSSFTGGREASLLIGALLILTGLLLRFKGSGLRDVQDVTVRDMVILGLAQGFSILPGVSRSGTTLTLLLMRHLKQDAALTISFIISVPAVLGALVLDHSLPQISPLAAASMFSASLIVGYLSMDLLIRFSQRVDFSKFCLSIGLITLIFAIGL
jgi:undecaprenyl-diphosphatase